MVDAGDAGTGILGCGVGAWLVLLVYSIVDAGEPGTGILSEVMRRAKGALVWLMFPFAVGS